MITGGGVLNNRDERQKIIKNFIRANTVQSFRQIFKQVDCSEVTLRRDLHQINCITSYSHQGKFVTLNDIPVYNEYGIWFYQEIGFTKHRNSLELIVQLINSSKDGYTREQLQEILKIQIFQQIQILLRQEKLHRVKIGNKYKYLPEALAKNSKTRLRLLSTDSVEEYYDARVSSSDLVALLKAVLVEKKITIDVQSLKNFAQKYCLKIPLKKIEQLLLKFNLTEKKTLSN